ncbi:uncharacterized protein NPIL_492661 [Nephila pilipes]|uniref:Gustatory receptor n=1 Tax=Nephila pilipes TaxID=299642 RepID=A0A8X6NDA1_NEPPI|nr:uncharacterized protein NPIL_492661 [Nephila pilipes]
MKDFLLRAYFGSHVAFFKVLPSLSGIACYCILFLIYRLLTHHLNRLQKIIQEDNFAIHLNGYLADLTKTVKLVKDMNALLSPIIFVLMTFWITGIFYNLSKLIFGNAFPDDLSFASTICNILSYSVQFLILLILSSEIPVTVSKMKSLVLQVPEDQFYYHWHVFPNKTTVPTVFLLIPKFDNFTDDVTVTAFGILKLNRNVILVSVGTIVTYELLLIQMLER